MIASCPDRVETDAFRPSLDTREAPRPHSEDGGASIQPRRKTLRGLSSHCQVYRGIMLRSWFIPVRCCRDALCRGGSGAASSFLSSHRAPPGERSAALELYSFQYPHPVAGPRGEQRPRSSGAPHSSRAKRRPQVSTPFRGRTGWSRIPGRLDIAG